MNDNRRIVKNTMFLYIRMFLIMGVSLYTSRLVLQELGVEDFGLYNVVGGIVTMFTFLNGALSGATSRYLTFELGRKDFDRLHQVFNVALLIHVFIAIIVVFLAETIGLWFLYHKMIIPEDRFQAAFWVYQISIATSVFTLTQVPYNAAIIAHENMRIYAYVGIIEVVCRLLVVYLLCMSPIDKLVFYALLLFLIQIVIMFFYRGYCLHHYEESRFKIYRKSSLYKEIFSYAGYDLIGNISVLAQGQGINILLNMFFGPTVNAARAIAYQVQGAVTQFSNNFMTAVKPQIIKSYASGHTDDMMKLVVQSSCFSYYLMWMIAFPICLEAKYILSLWLGNYPDHTVEFIYLIMALCLIQTLKTPRTTVFHATGHIRLPNIVIGTILCAALPLAYLFLKLGLPAESVFWASNATMLISEIASILILKKYINYSSGKYVLSVHLRCLAVTVVSFIVPYLLYERTVDESFLRLVFTCILTTFSVAFTVLLIGMDRETRKRLFSIISSKLKK